MNRSDDTYTRALRDGDEVEVRVPGVVAQNGEVILVDGNPWFLRDRVVDVGGQITVTRGADHSSRDPIGTIRAGVGHVWIKVMPYANDVHSDNVWWDAITHEERTGSVEEWPVDTRPLVDVIRDVRAKGEES